MGPQYLLSLLLLMSVWTWAGSAWAVLVCSDVTAANNLTPSSSSKTTSYTTPTGSNQVLFALSGIRHTTFTINSATHAGNAMTAIAAASTLSPVIVRGFYIINPTSGTNNVVVNYSGQPLADAIVILVCSGVDTASPIHDPTNASGTGTAVSNTVPSVVSGEVVLDWFIQDVETTAPTIGSNQTELNKGTDASELGWGASQQAGSDGGVMSWTTALSQEWASQAFAVKPLSSSTTTQFRRRLMP